MILMCWLEHNRMRNTVVQQNVSDKKNCLIHGSINAEVMVLTPYFIKFCVMKSQFFFMSEGTYSYSCFYRIHLNKPNVFEIVTPTRVYYLQVSSVM